FSSNRLHPKWLTNLRERRMDRVENKLDGGFLFTKKGTTQKHMRNTVLGTGAAYEKEA
ncbi:hypothetical protein CRM22_007499, partial [Opisthorchis felineus]